MTNGSKTIGEAEFVGKGRRFLVDGLVNLFDGLRSSAASSGEDRQTVWVSLAAPSGAGKTRLVHEFYARCEVTSGISCFLTS